MDGVGWRKAGQPISAGGGTLGVYSPADQAAAIGVTGNSGSGQFTLGCEFGVARGGLVISGVKFRLANNADAVGTYRVDLWDSYSGVNQGSRTAAGVGPGTVTIDFLAPIALGAYTRYIASYVRTDAMGHYRFTDPANVPNPASSGPELSGIVIFYSLARWVGGVGFPSAVAAANRYPVGPVIAVA